MAAKTFPVEASHILMFARSVGDENVVYTDAEAAKATEAGGIIAPPTFVQASAQFDPRRGGRSAGGVAGDAGGLRFSRVRRLTIIAPAGANPNCLRSGSRAVDRAPAWRPPERRSRTPFA